MNFVFRRRKLHDTLHNAFPKWMVYSVSMELIRTAFYFDPLDIICTRAYIADTIRIFTGLIPDEEDIFGSVSNKLVYSFPMEGDVPCPHGNGFGLDIVNGAYREQLESWMNSTSG